MVGIVVVTPAALLVARRASTWTIDEHLGGRSPECVAVDSGSKLAHAFGEGRLKSGFGGLHIESNHRLMYTSEWASPQKCRAPVAFAASEFQR